MKPLLFLFLFLIAPLYAERLFLNSTPSGADVFLVQQNTKSKPQSLGKTPILFTNTNEVTLIISKTGYASQTNQYKLEKKYTSEEIFLAPLSFTINFPEERGSIFVNGKHYTSLDGNLVLPYGNYDTRYDKKKGTFAMNAKSPYTPYVAVFATMFLASLGMAIGGFAMQPVFYDQFLGARDFDIAVNALSLSSAMNNMAYTGVGIGTGSLIGLAIFSYYEDRERRRIKRFMAVNEDFQIVDDLNDFNDILNNPEQLEDRLSSFIRKYKNSYSRYMPQVLFKRAEYYFNKNEYTAAARDIDLIISTYPTLDLYASVQKLAGQIAWAREQYYDAYRAYKEGTLIELFYPELQKEALKALKQATENDSKYQKLLEQEIQETRADRRFKDNNFLKDL